MDLRKISLAPQEGMEGRRGGGVAGWAAVLVKGEGVAVWTRWTGNGRPMDMEVKRREESRAAPQCLLWERGSGGEELGGGQAVPMSGQEAEIPLDGLG